jgi:hypothetical protein
MRKVQRVAVFTAAVAAVLYFLIGLGVLHIGRSTQGTGDDLLGFGLASGSAYLTIAVLIYFVRSRAVWILIAAFDAMVIVVYFAVAGIRVPPYEVWGVLIKVLQLVLLAAVVYLAVRAPKRQAKAQRTAELASGPSVEHAVTSRSSSQAEYRRQRR